MWIYEDTPKYVGHICATPCKTGIEQLAIARECPAITDHADIDVNKVTPVERDFAGNCTSLNGARMGPGWGQTCPGMPRWKWKGGCILLFISNEVPKNLYVGTTENCTNKMNMWTYISVHGTLLTTFNYNIQDHTMIDDTRTSNGTLITDSSLKD